VIKLGRIGWARHVEHTVRGVAYTGNWWGNLREINYSREPGVDGRIIFRWIFGK
jgi:hypothetical protein